MANDATTGQVWNDSTQSWEAGAPTGITQAVYEANQAAQAAMPTPGYDFGAGVNAYTKQGLTAGGNYEGLPTQYTDPRTGALAAWYGTFNGNNNPGDFTWHTPAEFTNRQVVDPKTGDLVSAMSTPTQAAESKYNAGQLNRDFLAGNAMVLGSMAGSSALGPMLAGGAGATALPVAGSAAIPAIELGGGALATTDVGSFLAADAAASAAGQGAFDVASALGMPLDQAVTAGLIDGAGSLTDAGAAALLGGTAGGGALPAGVTAADVAKYGSMSAKALGALTSGAAGTGTGTGSGIGTGSNASQQPYYNPNGPWNAAPVATNLTWTPHAQTPATAGDSNLAMLHPALASQLAQHGMFSSNLGGQQQQPQSQPYYTYGSQPQQTTQSTAVAPVDAPDWTLGYANGGNVHIPEFITGATGHYVKGRGDGQADLIPAMLADGEYVMDSSAVSTLGNGSSDAGAKLLDAFRESLREHTRSAPVDKIPPKASPLQYMKNAMKKVGMK